MRIASGGCVLYACEDNKQLHMWWLEALQHAGARYVRQSARAATDEVGRAPRPRGVHPPRPDPDGCSAIFCVFCGAGAGPWLPRPPAERMLLPAPYLLSSDVMCKKCQLRNEETRIREQHANRGARATRARARALRFPRI